MKLLVFFALATTLWLSACSQPPEVLARDSIVGAKAFLDKEKAAHPECATSKAGFCGFLSKATGAKDVAIDALEAYCAGPAFDTGGACQAPLKGTATSTQLLNKLSAAIQGMNQTIADVKKAGGIQ